MLRENDDEEHDDFLMNVLFECLNEMKRIEPNFLR